MNKQCILERSVIALIFTIYVNNETINDWFYSILSITDRYRVISIAYVNNETLNDFYSILLIAEQCLILQHIVNNESISRNFYSIC